MKFVSFLSCYNNMNFKNKSKKILETIAYTEKLKNLEEQEKEFKPYSNLNRKKPFKKKTFY